MQAAQRHLPRLVPGDRARRARTRLLRAPALGLEALGRRRTALAPRGLEVYARICGWTLARAHARSGDRFAIASYLGGGDSFDRAICSFAADYAEQNLRDHQALLDAIDSGRVTAEDA